VYEFDGPLDDGEGDDGPQGHFKIWLDDQTKMPLKETATDIQSGSQVGDAYWSYDRGRLETTQVASDFFRVAEPDSTESQESTDYRGGAAIGPTQDTETGTSFNPMFLGSHLQLAGLGDLCFSGTDVINRTDSSLVTGTFAPSDPDLEPDPASPNETYVDANYNLPTGDCAPGSDNFPTATLGVMSMASGSSIAAAYRNEYTAQGDPVPIDAPDESRYEGIEPVTTGFGPAVAYLVRTSENESSALMDVGDTTVVITGPFDRTQIGTLASLLEAQ
jgi:hypothetical protein